MPFQKGISGNSNGRPKNELSMSTIIREALEEENESGVKYKLVIARRLRHLASFGNMMAIREIINRTDGLPKQRTEYSGDLPIPIIGGDMGVRFFSEESADNADQKVSKT